LFAKYKRSFEEIDTQIKVMLIDIVTNDNMSISKILIDESFNNFDNMSDSSLKSQIKDFLSENKDNFKKGIYWDTNSEKFYQFCESLILKQEKEFLTKVEESFSKNIKEEDVGFSRLEVFTKALKSVNVITQILNADFSKIKKIFETKENESLMCENTLKYALKEFKEELQLKENESFKKELEKSSFKSATQMLE
jgi:hypothetical protein